MRNGKYWRMGGGLGGGVEESRVREKLRGFMVWNGEGREKGI